MLPLLALMLLVAGCGAETVRTTDEAAVAIRKILDGASPSDFKLADDATAATRAILADGSEVGGLQSVLSIASDKGCDAAGLAANLGDKDEEGGISLSAAARNEIHARIQASYPDATAADMAAFVDPVLNAIVGLTESSVTQTVDKVCSSGL